MSPGEIDKLQKVAHTVRALSADAIEKQESGHPGLPLGAAEIGTYIYTKVLKHNPKDPQWAGRDRFILSAGHGSMLQYALLHLTGYNLSLDEIKNFRQLHSLTPGHPEFGETPGIEVTTGPLGQGVAAGTGMAITQKFLAQRFGYDLFDYKIWVLAGDGCMMEGISSEASSLAGTLGLDNLVLIYDSNDVCLDGPINEVFKDDVTKRYEAYGFNVMTIDGYDFNEIERAFSKARIEKEKPTLIIAKTIIGKHSPTRQGKSISHGKFLGPDELTGFKKEIGWPLEPSFYIPGEVKEYLKSLQPIFEKYQLEWEEKLEIMKEENPGKAIEWETFKEGKLPPNFKENIWNMKLTPNQPTRKYNEAIIAKVAEIVPWIISGSADVASVDLTWLPGNKIASAKNWDVKQIKFGVREFCMAAAAYGMNLHGMLQPIIGTFLTFSDYMRNAIRMTALMKQRVIYIFSHDSIMLAQDGPTHQPVEHLMSLRLIPNLTLIRPGDENESKAAWIEAFRIKGGPVALCFTRQPVSSTISELTLAKSLEGLQHGAYILYGKEDGFVDLEIFASGSEIHPSVAAAKKLEEDNYSVRVISVPSWELFERQDGNYKKTIIGQQAGLKVSVEAGVGLGWERFVDTNGLIISQETYGESAPSEVLADYFGFTADKIYKKIKKTILITA